MDQVAKAKQESQAEIPVDREYSFDTILGSSMAIREAIALAKKVSVTDVPVLLTGETGTGERRCSRRRFTGIANGPRSLSWR